MTDPTPPTPPPPPPPPVDPVDVDQVLDPDRTCSRCGCSEEAPCAFGCAWLLGSESVDGTLICSSCVAPSDPVAWQLEANRHEIRMTRILVLQLLQLEPEPEPADLRSLLQRAVEEQLGLVRPPDAQGSGAGLVVVPG